MSRGRGGRSAHESEESSASVSSAPQPSAATHEDEEMPLARVRETAIAVKACGSLLSFIFVTVLNLSRDASVETCSFCKNGNCKGNLMF